MIARGIRKNIPLANKKQRIREGSAITNRSTAIIFVIPQATLKVSPRTFKNNQKKITEQISSIKISPP